MLDKARSAPPGPMAAAPSADRGQNLGRVPGRVWREHRLLLGVSLAYCAAVAVLLHAAGLGRFHHLNGHYWYITQFFLFWGLGLAAVEFGNNRPIAGAIPLERALGAAVIWLLTPFVLDSFNSLKQALVHLVPYSWDPALHRVDVALHWGMPWTWLRPAMEWRWFAAFMDWIYIAWFGVTLTLLAGFSWSRHRRLRQRYLLTYVLSWIVLGSFGAALLGSGGPCYYTVFVPQPDPYAPLWPVLDQHDLVARRIQPMLLQAMQAGRWVPFSGISAMPSLHVAQAVLVAIVAWRHRWRSVRLAGLSFALLIQAGSVALGWHYAVDGYVAAIVMLGLWWGAGRATDRNPQVTD